MDAEELRAIQTPLKQRYRDQPDAARVPARAEGSLDPNDIAIVVDAWHGKVTAGLHKVGGGSGELACSADMLLEALVGCAGVTLRAVATSLGIEVTGGTVAAEGDLDFRGTLGVSKEVPVGFQAIRLHFDLDTDATPEQLATLLKLTERYCVVLQTLANPVQVSASVTATTS